MVKELRSSDRTLRKREKVEYNLTKLSLAPKAEPKKKVLKKRKATKKKNPIKASYLELIKRALRGTKDTYLSYQAIVKFIESKFPDKSEKRHIRSALAEGVRKKVLVKSRLSYRFSKKEQEKQAKKKKTTKTTKTTKKSSSSAKKKVAKKPAKKSKSSTSKAASVKKVKKASTPKKAKKSDKPEEAAATKSPKKKTTKTSKKATAEAAEAGSGKPVWQYYDLGWHDYRAEASDIVEGVYQEYVANPGTGIDVRSVKSGKFHYLVDFTSMTQKNTETSTVRNIQRRIA